MTNITQLNSNFIDQNILYELHIMYQIHYCTCINNLNKINIFIKKKK